MVATEVIWLFMFTLIWIIKVYEFKFFVKLLTSCGNETNITLAPKCNAQSKLHLHYQRAFHIDQSNAMFCDCCRPFLPSFLHNLNGNFVFFLPSWYEYLYIFLTALFWRFSVQYQFWLLLYKLYQIQLCLCNFQWNQLHCNVNFHVVSTVNIIIIYIYLWI